ncbi:MAG: ATP-binding protein [Planctomycetes bacterium]|nr:ATP-binding protein [Planctomycetota bacterium]
MKRLEKGRMFPQRAIRLLKKIQPWIKQQITEQNYLPMPPTIEDLNLNERPFDVELGTLTERPEVPFGMYVRTGVHHMIIVGKPGSGKTVTLKVYIKSIIDSFIDDCPVFMVFDSKKDFINPEKIFGNNVAHLPVLDSDKFRISQSPPLDVPASIFAGPICTVLAARLGMIVSRTCLSEIYRWLYPLLSGPPSPELILDCLTNAPSWCWGEKLDYISFLIQTLHGYVIEGGGTFSAETGFDPNKFIKKGIHCVFDIANCEPVTRRYIIFDTILLQILLHSTHNHKKTNRVRICLVIDEADFFAQPSAQAVYPDSLSILTLMARLAREYGIQIIICVSGLQNVAPYLRTGCDCLIVHRSTDSESIWVIQNTLGVPNLEKLLPALKDGQCIFRYSSCDYPYPFLGQVKFIEPDHSQKTKPYDSVQFTKPRRLKDLPHVQKALKERIEERSNTKLRQSKAKAVKGYLTKNERTFLKLMSLREYKPLNLIFDEIGITSAGVQKQIIKKLLEQKYIEAVTFRSESSWYRLGQLIDKGWKFNNDSSKYPSTRGNLIHKTISYSIMFLGQKRGYEESSCEKQLYGTNGFCDALHRNNGQLHTFEVIVGCSENITIHVRTAFIDCTESIASLTIVTALKSEHNKIEEKILADPELAFHISKIHFTTAAQIFKELWS